MLTEIKGAVSFKILVPVVSCWKEITNYYMVGQQGTRINELDENLMRGNLKEDLYYLLFKKTQHSCISSVDEKAH